MKYILDSDKAYGIRLSIKNNNDFHKFCEILFYSSRTDIFTYLEKIYWLSDKDISYQFHFYVKAETYDDENKLKERHFLWHEKNENEFRDLILTNRYVGFMDEK